ncbi:MAG: 3-oxoacyl-[acyl-carrier-protein] reductase [candidate division WOR-3 bacterium]|nr:3-oxoacyl-[acyl-carrier-protein] reductase [candidate division WOR-3 bacterium]MDH5683039.1 3-oxoacyl-[acyl-carrier-protein] reductase [candidate division WOR-3 bacterium]
MPKLKGKKVVVTGAGSGIGKAIAKRFAEEEALIAVCDVNLETANLVAKEIGIIGAKGLPYKVDVSSFTDVTAAVKKIAEALGGIEILINNAGITKDTLLLRMSEEDFDKVIGVNLKGTFNFTKACTKYLIKEEWGRIINITSIIGEMGNAGQANYAAAKAGIIGFTKSIAKELASRKITVNAIAPGFIKTPMTENLPENIKENYRKLIPLNHEGEPEDVANLCIFLASEEASYITGQIIRVDGGMLM